MKALPKVVKGSVNELSGKNIVPVVAGIVAGVIAGASAPAFASNSTPTIAPTHSRLPPATAYSNQVRLFYWLNLLWKDKHLRRITATQVMQAIPATIPARLVQRANTQGQRQAGHSGRRCSWITSNMEKMN
jgi:hypothetical protein